MAGGLGSVFLLTDYGHTDEFAGVVRAVVARRAPDARIVDITNDVPAFDVRAGALALTRAVPYLGAGVVLAVVDPGVGTARRAVAVAARAADGGPLHFVGPDNGLLCWAIDEVGGARAAAFLRAPAGSSPATFDGRDVFAPAAARLWQGEPLTALGTTIDPDVLVRLDAPRCTVTAGVVEAEVLWVDRFGNAQLAARPGDERAAGLGGDLEVVAAGRAHNVRRVSAFAELDGDALGVFTDANGHLAVACHRQPAAAVLDVHAGDTVLVRRRATAREEPQG
jgi:S-adenosylmethionine hydrolase